MYFIFGLNWICSLDFICSQPQLVKITEEGLDERRGAIKEPHIYEISENISSATQHDTVFLKLSMEADCIFP